MAYVYILTNKYNTVLYIGVTNDLLRRTYEHKEHLIKGFSSRYQLNKLVYYETHASIAQAIEREKQLKNWHREWKNNLIHEKTRTGKIYTGKSVLDRVILNLFQDPHRF